MVVLFLVHRGCFLSPAISRVLHLGLFCHREVFGRVRKDTQKHCFATPLVQGRVGMACQRQLPPESPACSVAFSWWLGTWLSQSSPFNEVCLLSVALCLRCATAIYEKHCVACGSLEFWYVPGRADPRDQPPVKTSGPESLMNFLGGNATHSPHFCCWGNGCARYESSQEGTHVRKPVHASL